MKQILQKMKQYAVVVLLVLMGNYGWGQTWSYDFGTGSGTHPTNTASTTFLTNLPGGGGTYRVRTGSSGGTIILANPGTSLGSGSELNIVSSTSASTNKFGVYSWNSLTTIATVKYKLRTTSGGNGNLNFSLGTSALGSDSNAYNSSYNSALTSITIAYGSGSISSVVRRINGSNTTINSSGFAKNTDHSVEVYANNGNSTVNYTRNGTSYSLATKTWDFWLDNVRIVNNGATAGTLAANTNLSGFAFYAENSSSNSASIFIDDLEYSNSLPNNAAPVASLVNITGTNNVGQTLTGSYTYTDADGDTEGASTYKWYRADDASGSNSAAISGATATTYTLQAADNGKYIRFGVVPVAQTGTSPGVEAFSSWQGPVTDPTAVTATLTPSVALTEQNLNGEILTLTLENTTFTDATLDAANFTLNNAPAGVVIDAVEYDTPTTALITLLYDDTDFDASIANFSITTAASELSAAQNLTSSTVSITAVAETLSVSTITSFGSPCLNSETTQTFTVSGANLKVGNVSLAALSGFTYSLDNTNFTPTLTIASAGGTLAATTIHVKFVPTAVQSYNGNIVVSGVGAASQNRSVVASGINTAPTLTTPTSTSITASSAVLGGNVTVIGCTPVTTRGIEYSTTTGFSNGTGTVVSESGTFSTGTFAVNVSGLTSGTTYYFKAFATSASGTSYTTQGTFSTLKTEPTNHPTNFVATSVTTGAIVPQWTASLAGSQAPDGYLIKASTTTVVDPVDGTDPSDSVNISGGSANRKVTSGSATSDATFTNMSSGTMYNYKIYPYTNSGATIDFKITDAVGFNHATLPTAPTALTSSLVQESTATLSWTAGTFNAGYDFLVFVKSSSAITSGSPTFTPSNYTANPIFGQGTVYQNDVNAFCVYKGDATTVNISGLNPNETYHVAVYKVVEASNSDGTNSYSTVLVGNFLTLTNPVTVPYAQDFENATTEWVLDNSGTNKWSIGSATQNGGSKALYISNDGGVSNVYTTNATQTTNASIRADLSGLTNATLTFDWKSNGELFSGTVYDYGEVYINTGGSDVLISGTREFYNTTTFAQKSIDISAYTGSIVTLKFRWVNDNADGNQPPFAVDNVAILPYGLPSFTTSTVTSITNTSAISGATITSDGGSSITNRGIVYATTANPTTSNFVISDGSGTGTFTANLFGLLSNTTYYVRAFVTTTNGTYYANEVSFTTTNIAAPLALNATGVGATSFTATWDAVQGATGYEIDVYEGGVIANQDIAAWTFPISGTTVTPDIASSNNTTKNLTTNGGTIASSVGASTQSASANDWSSASNSKFWQIELNTTDFSNIRLSSKQRSSGTGPRDFKVQYNIGSGWVDVSGGAVTVANDFTTGVITDLSLPSACNNQSNLLIRWIMTSNTSVGNGTVSAGGSSRIDDIYVVGDLFSLVFVSGYNALSVGNVTSYPITGLDQNTAYYYVVRALDATSESVNSNEIEVKTYADISTADFRSKTSGNFNSLSTWEYNTGVPSVGNSGWLDTTQLPTTDNNVTILVSHSVTVNTDLIVAVSKELVINSGATLIVASSNSLQVAGGLTNNGTIVFKSDAFGSARFGQFTGNISGSGKVTVERYIPAKRAWRLLTAPVKGTTNNSINANWQGTNNEGVLLWHPSGNETNGLSVGPQANIFSYTNGWQAISNATTSPLFTQNDNNAFLVFATGPHGSTTIAGNTTPIATTLKPKGELITGSITKNLTAYQLYLIGNPYASPINTETLVQPNSGNKVWLLDPSLGSFGGYVAFDGINWSSPTLNENKNIQSGQAFFVANSATTTFTISESHKVSGNSNTWFEKTANTENTENADKIRVLLYKQDNTNWRLADGILAVNSAIGNDAVDATDTNKMTNFNETILFRNGTSNLAIEYRGLPLAGTVQPMRLTGTTVQPYQLRVYTENYSNSDLQPYIEDTQTGTLTAIPIDGSIVTLPFTGQVANSTTPDNRFRISYQAALSNNNPSAIFNAIYPNPVQDGWFTIDLKNNMALATYSLINLLGQEVQTGELTAQQNLINVKPLEQGVYVLQINQEGKTVTTKLIIK